MSRGGVADTLIPEVVNTCDSKSLTRLCDREVTDSARFGEYNGRRGCPCERDFTAVAVRLRGQRGVNSVRPAVRPSWGSVSYFPLLLLFKLRGFP